MAKNFYRPHHKVIYKITHTSGTFYIGQSKDFSERIGCHVSNILLGKHALGTSTTLEEYTFSILINAAAMSDSERIATEKRLIRYFSANSPGCCNKTHNTRKTKVKGVVGIPTETSE